MKGFLRAACFAVLTFLSIGGVCRAEQPVPPLAARVTDETGTLTAAERATLEQSLKDFETRKGSQIAVLIVPTTQPETIEQYSIRVVEQWKLGRANVDDGALLIIAKNDRALRIEVGYGLEGVLTDATSRRIIDELIVPSFRRGDFYGGVSAGVGRMLTDSAPRGFAPDWALYRAGRGFEPDAETHAASAYNAIRVYLWAGMLDAGDPLARPLVAHLAAVGLARLKL